MIIIRKHAQVPMVCEKLYVRVVRYKVVILNGENIEN